MSGRGVAKKTKHLIEVSHNILAEIQPTTVRGVAYQLFNRKRRGTMTSRQRLPNRRKSEPNRRKSESCLALSAPRSAYGGEWAAS
jgi:hypothetical protein